MITRFLLFFILILIPLSATAEKSIPQLFTDPVVTHKVEADTEALFHWRELTDSKPPLILLSSSPLLKPVAKLAKKEAQQLAQNSSLANIRKRAVYPASDPLFFPGSALTIALDLNWFSEILWVVPVKTGTQFPTLPQFIQSVKNSLLEQLLDLENLTLEKQCFSSKLKKTPIRICSLAEKIEINQPAIFHAEMSYFEGLHVNPIKTPIFQTLLEQAASIRNQKWPIKMATISSGNIQGSISLDVRFLADSLKQLTENPQIMNEKTEQFGNAIDSALYTENMYLSGEAHAIYLNLKEKFPDNPHLNYLLYNSYSRTKNGSMALESLAKAVSADPVYALEYLTLHDLAREKGQPAAAITMLNHAETAFPENPFIKWQTANFLASLKHKEMALPYIEKLQEMTWSKIYYPDVHEQLKSFGNFVKNSNKTGKEKSTSSTPSVNSAD